VNQPVDSSILHEIVRVVETRRKVPDRVQVRSREYQITYLDDHQRRMEEAIHRFDGDRLNMLYGQLASKVKYQMLRRVPARPQAKAKAAAPKKAKATAKGPKKPKPAKRASRGAPPKTKKAKKPGKSRVAKGRSAARAAKKKKTASRRSGATAKKTGAAKK
jgi:hypothetical protein